LQQGSEILAALLRENDIENITQKQTAVQELAEMPEWRQDFSAIAALVKTDVSHNVIVRWIKQYSHFVPPPMKYLPWLFTAASVLLFGSYFLDLVSGWIPVWWFFLGLAITGRFFGKINKLSSDTSKIQSTFQQYQKLLSKLEDTTFQSSFLKDKMAEVISMDQKASVVMKSFARLLNALDQRNNMLIGIPGNAFMLRDLQLSYSIEKWIDKNGSKVKTWFHTIAVIDAYNSLGNFAFNHPSYTYPQIVQGSTVLKASDIAHPMLAPSKRVANDIEIREQEFFIITGANMAGKSTFLRTVSLQMVMANTGLPVCASRVSYSPIKLITSMRTTDSLTKDESYFFSELKRLKFIVSKIESDSYFIVLDEILKGTNSVDKAEGSRKFVEKLVESRSTGIIATHDLSLCEISEEEATVKNYYFDAEIINDELHFDYQFRKGICQNMNASFLLKKMGIVK
jgi:DNA mismatch repair ATPase MutS